jgi:nucleoside-diphosphate-sugar epimerase
MKILVAGATGVIGRRLVPLLVASGHEVIGTTRTADKGELLQQLGATPQVVDAFDRARLVSVVRETHPEVIIQQLTDLSAGSSAANARMRREGTRNLVDAAHATGVHQFIAQSISWVTAPGDGPADETVPLDLEAPEPRRTTVEGVEALERAVAEMERGVVLRYGTLYGLGTWYAPEGAIAQQVRQRQLTADEGITSFLHVEDAARAALLALDWPRAGSSHRGHALSATVAGGTDHPGDSRPGGDSHRQDAGGGSRVRRHPAAWSCHLRVGLGLVPADPSWAGHRIHRRQPPVDRRGDRHRGRYRGDGAIRPQPGI